MPPEILQALADLLRRDLTRERGPVKWCRRCSRRHARHAGCGLIEVAVQAKSGRMVRRWVHP